MMVPSCISDIPFDPDPVLVEEMASGQIHFEAEILSRPGPHSGTAPDRELSSLKLHVDDILVSQGLHNLHGSGEAA